MSKLQQLIQEYCPNGVEWKTLGEVAEIFDGTHLTPKYTTKGVPFVSVQNIKNLYATDKFISIDDFDKYKCKPRKDDLFMTRIGNIGTCALVKNDEPLAYYVTLTLIRVNKYIILPGFLKYVIESKIGKSELSKRTLVKAVPIKINLGEIGKISIPIPPLAIQTEIVSILDKFSTLTAELQAELQARKSQYEYYRNQLLDYPMEESDQPSLRSSQSATSIKNNDNLSQQISKLNPHTDNSVLQPRGKVEWKKLGEIANIKNGKDWKQLKEGKYPVYGSGGIMCYVDTYAYNKPSVLIPRKGSLGNLFYIDTPFWNVDTIFYTEINDSLILPKFLYYFLTTVGLSNMNQAGGVPSQTQNALNRVLIPIPSLAEQERIVTILDKFDTLTNSITEGLPKEIELRQKQYEYYRDMLLTFPRTNA